MKNIVLVLLFLAIATGCNKNEKAEISALPNNETKQEIVNDDVNKSFEERIQVVSDYKEEFTNTYGELDYINGERFISNAELIKSGDYYTMRFSFISPRLYDETIIKNALREAQKNGTYEFEKYTFYKDFESFINVFVSDGYRDIINEFANYETDSIFVTSDNMAYFFKPMPNDKTKYVRVWAGLPTGAIDIIDEDIKIDVLLLPNDSIIIDNSHYDINYSADDIQMEYKLTVEEFYNRALNEEMIRTGGYVDGDEYYYKFDNNNIGSTAGYAGLQNAVILEKDGIKINLPVQGGL